jgi:hypothetical protein
MSSIDGFIGSGGSFSTLLSVGTHTITAAVDDSEGVSGDDQVTYTINALLDVPNVTGLEQSVAESAIVAGNLVVGTVTMSPSATVPAGEIISQNPVACSACVAPGSSVDLVVSSGPPNETPIISITAPQDGAVIPEGLIVIIEGTAIDTEDGNISNQISWTSNKDGLLGSGPSISAVLSKGRHTIDATVTDSGGASASQQIRIRISKN